MIFGTSHQQRQHRLAICVYSTNAAQTLRAVEIAKAIEDIVNQGGQINKTILRFFTYRGSLTDEVNSKKRVDYEHVIRQAGFDVEYFGKLPREEGNQDASELPSDDDQNQYAAAVLDDEMWSAFLRAEKDHLGIFPPPYDMRATPYLRAVIQTLSEFHPDVVLYGLFPEVAVASKIKGWNTVAFGPLPMYCDDWMKKHLYGPSNASELSPQKSKTARARVHNPYAVLESAAKECGLTVPFSNFRDVLRPNRTIVCDFECFYEDDELPLDVSVVGPVISSSLNSVERQLPREVEQFLYSDDSKALREDGMDSQIRVFLTMGSTGDLNQFCEALHAIHNANPGTFKAIISIPANLLESNELNSCLSSDQNENKKDVLILKGFVPALAIMKHVDVVVSHGGQSTIQSAFAAGVPIVATPNQAEQRFNLKNVEKCHAGVCIPREEWREDAIREALLRVGGGTRYKMAVLGMKEKFENGQDAVRRAAEIVLDELCRNSGLNAESSDP